MNGHKFLVTLGTVFVYFFSVSPSFSEPKTPQEAIEQLVLANRILANEGVLDAFGHVSVRNPGNPKTFFQSRSLSPSEVTTKDILEIDLEGKLITKTDMKPYGERFIHSAIFKARPDVNAVFHGHPHEVIPFTVTNTPIRPIAHFGGFLCEGVSLYDDYDVSSGMIVGTLEEAERLARVLGKNRVELMRGHGCNIGAENLPALVMMAIYLRDNAKVQFQAILLGQPKYLSYEEARKAFEKFMGPVAQARAWGYWVTRAKTAMPDMR